MENKEILAHFQLLSFQEQKDLIRDLVKITKNPPYSITFNLDNPGFCKMAKVISYCKKYSIPYIPEQKGKTKITLVFENLSVRNTVLIGRLTI